MDLVVRFLKKAASNLKDHFTVVVPNHQLPLRDRYQAQIFAVSDEVDRLVFLSPHRRRILARQLADFVILYRKVLVVYKCKEVVLADA